MKSSARVAVIALLGAVGAGCTGPTVDIPTINLSSSQAQDGRISVTFAQGGPSVTRDVTVHNVSACALDYTAQVEDAWLSVAPPSGTIAANGSATLTVTVSSGDSEGLLPLGTFLGTVVINATCTETGVAAVGSPAAVAIHVTVGGGSDAGVRPDGGSVADAGSDGGR